MIDGTEEDLDVLVDDACDALDEMSDNVANFTALRRCLGLPLTDLGLSD